MKYYKLIFAIIIVSVSNIFAQEKSIGDRKRPALVVGIVVDQMRYDYLYKFWEKYSEDGFKRLVRNGFVFSNANYNYVPTYTGPGHACIYTGTGPANNGIVSNEWYDRDSHKVLYCVSDSTVKSVGTSSISGKMSPKNLYTSTVTDELRLATNMKSKVIGVALKDRGAILPAGHSANAAYWHDPYTNNWVSSTWYMNELPKWVDDFNGRKMVDSLLNKTWNTLLPIEKYTESTADDNAYEGVFKTEKKPVFPHDLFALRDSNSELIRATPFGNLFTKEFAIAACQGEKLGKGKVTDFLTVSFSSTDYVGHKYGINSIELEDTYLRLDKDIAALLKFLDDWTDNNYLLFLTADHGAANNPVYSTDNRLAGGKIDSSPIADSLNARLISQFGVDSLIESSGAEYIYLNRELIERKNIRLQEVQEFCATIVMKFPEVALAMTGTELSKGLNRTGIYSLLQNGFNMRRSPDVMIQLQSGWIDWYVKTGTTHGTAYTYDTHVPVIFFGKEIKQGTTSEVVTVSDIAPTVSNLLNIENPSGTTGHSIMHFFK
jgi:predicted AlkP superfamily pyrophosphatase or phosphodiesterase